MVIPLRDDNPTRTRPVLTLAIIAACIVVFVAVQPRDRAEQDFLFQRAAIPCEITNGAPLSNALSARCDGQVRASDAPPGAEFFPSKNVYLAVLTSMFLHGSWLHLLSNMLFLWIFGNNIEERLGKLGYVGFYLLTGVAATAAHVFTQADSTIPLVGASGAIAGVMGAYLVFFPRARVLTIVPLFIFMQFVYLPAFVVLLGWFALQFLTNFDSGVAVVAHIGGFAAGAAIALLARPFFRPRRPPASDNFGLGSGPYA